MKNIDLTKKQVKQFRAISKVIQEIAGPNRWALLAVSTTTFKLHFFDAITRNIDIREGE